MTSKLARERLEKIKSWRETYGAGSNVMLPADEAEELARMALAAMECEPHTDDELSNLLWYSQEATCHSDPNYSCEFQRLATPGLVAGIILELQERRKADSEPVAVCIVEDGQMCPDGFGECDHSLPDGTHELFAAPQPVPVVPKSISVRQAISALESADAVTTIGQAYKMGWNACCAAMLNGGKP